MNVPIDSIKVKYNPRSKFDLPKEFVNSFTEVGLLQPLTVQETEDGYILLDGERRLRAVKQLGWVDVEVYIKDLDEVGQKQVPVLTDLMKDLLPLGDKAIGISHLVNKEKKFSEKSISKMLGMPLKRVKRLIKIARLHPSNMQRFNRGEFDEYVAEQLSSIQNEGVQLKVGKHMEGSGNFLHGLEQSAFLIDFDDVFLCERIKKDKALGYIYHDQDDLEDYIFCYDEKIAENAKAEYEEKNETAYANVEKKALKDKEKNGQSNMEREVKEKAEKKKKYKKAKENQVTSWESLKAVLPQYLSGSAQKYEVAKLVTRFSLQISTDMCKAILKAFEVKYKASEMISQDYHTETVKIISQYVKTEVELPRLILFVDMCKGFGGYTMWDMSGLKKVVVGMSKECKVRED